MSIFKTHGIVLKQGKYSEKELYYKILFRDYGILTVTKRKKSREKPIDTWYFVSCEIITHASKSVHTIGNIKINSYFQAWWKKYSEIELFLKILSEVHSQIPEGSPHYEIYDILSYYIEESSSLSYYKLILVGLKIKCCLGSLWESHPNETIMKILKFIHANKYSDILRLWAISDDLIKDLEQLF